MPRKFFTVPLTLTTVLQLLLLLPRLALAGHNPLHAYQEKVAGFLNEVSVTALIILPLVAILAIVFVAILRAVSKATGSKGLHEHDDSIKTILLYLVVGESASALVAILTYFFKPANVPS